MGCFHLHLLVVSCLYQLHSEVWARKLCNLLVLEIIWFTSLYFTKCQLYPLCFFAPILCGPLSLILIFDLPLSQECWERSSGTWGCIGGRNVSISLAWDVENIPVRVCSSCLCQTLNSPFDFNISEYFFNYFLSIFKRHDLIWSEEVVLNRMEDQRENVTCFRSYEEVRTKYRP